MKRFIKFLILSIIFLSFSSVTSQNKIDNVDDKIIQLSPNFYAIKDFPSLMLVCTGADGVLLSDAFHESKQKLLKAVLHKLGCEDVKIIINTHWHDDHTFGNKTYGHDATIIAHSKVRQYLSTDQVLPEGLYKAFPEYAQPDLLCDDELTIYFNNEEINIFPVTGGHTDSDIAVYFQNANVLHIGDLVFSKFFPYIDETHGGSVEGVINNLKIIINEFPEDIIIVPGHVDICTMDDLRNILKMIIDTREIVKLEIDMGKSLDKIIESEALKDWKHWEGPPVSLEYWTTVLYYSIKK